MDELQSRHEIDRRVDRLLRESEARFRFPTPIEDIIAAQRLALSREAESPLSPAILATAPAELQARIRAFGHKILAMLDRTERLIHVEPGGLAVRERFCKCHEVGHDLCPWHDERYYLDAEHHLDPGVRDLFEREANYAGARLLFQQDVFAYVARNHRAGFNAFKRLADLFGGSIHAAFRLHVESSPEAAAGFILRRPPMDRVMTACELIVKSTFASSAFTAQFPLLDSPPIHLSSNAHPDLLPALTALGSTRRPSEGQMHLPSRSGEPHSVWFELSSNSYDLLLLAHRPVRRATQLVLRH